MPEEATSGARLGAFAGELTRRKVWRVAAVYVVVALAVIAAASDILPRLLLPDWTVTLVVVLAILGLPVALVLAWGYDITREGIVRTELLGEDQAAGVPARQAAGPAPRPSAADASPDVSAETSGKASERSIVVLPLENMSPDPSDAYLADGLSEEITADLAGIRALRVISRTSAFQYKGAKKDARTIGRELSVRYVLEGSVRKAGDELRITCQLIDASADAHLWAKKYSGTMADIFDLQERVARSVAETLALSLTPSEDMALSSRPLPDAAAYQSYLTARQEVWTGTREALERALRHLTSAQEILGDNALVHAALAYVHFQKANFGYDQESAVEETERHARRALELDPECGEALVVLGAAAQAFRGKLDESIDFLGRALRLRPGNSDAMIWLGNAYHIVGRNLDALELVGRMVASDPLNPMSHLMKAVALWGCGRMDDALGAARESHRLGPDSPQTLMILAWSLAYAGRESELDDLTEGATLDRTGPAGLVLLLHACLARREAEARSLLTEEFEGTCRRDPEWSLLLSDCLAALGSDDEAMTWLENSVERGYANHPFLAEHDPLLTSLRGTDRFGKLLERAKVRWESFHAGQDGA